MQETYRTHGFHPWVRKIPWRRKWQPTPVFLPGDPHGQRSLVGYSPWAHTVRHDWATKQKELSLYILSFTISLLGCETERLHVSKSVRTVVFGLRIRIKFLWTSSDPLLKGWICSVSHLSKRQPFWVLFSTKLKHLLPTTMRGSVPTWSMVPVFLLQVKRWSFRVETGYQNLAIIWFKQKRKHFFLKCRLWWHWIHLSAGFLSVTNNRKKQSQTGFSA